MKYHNHAPSQGTPPREIEDPIDLLIDIAAQHEWSLRVNDMRHAVIDVPGQWQNYEMSAQYLHKSETLALSFSFRFSQNEESTGLYETLNLINCDLRHDVFTYLREEGVITLRLCRHFTLEMAESRELLGSYILSATETCDRYYPAFQLINFSALTPKSALRQAITGQYAAA